jgi:hypothetical protein
MKISFRSLAHLGTPAQPALDPDQTSTPKTVQSDRMTRFRLLRHVFGNPLHLAVMLAGMLASMAVAMMLAP